MFMFTPALALASGGGGLQHANIDPTDRISLQKGARTFMNYCLSCHSAGAMRYNRMAVDLGITEEQLHDNLMFVTEKSGDTMVVSMRRDDGEKWFGKAPPDLSVIARSRGANWLYTYFLSFYRDSSRALGVNNLVFKDVGMPHVLWELQGWQDPVYKTEETHDGGQVRRIEHLELSVPGRESAREYENTVRDLVNFLVYVGEPARMQRRAIGKWVIMFLLVLLGVSYLLKREYWKDVH